MAKLNPKTLFKIGTDWVFDVATHTGYKVIRSNNEVSDFITAFSIQANGNLSLSANTEVPAGVIRKAMHIIDMEIRGTLKKNQ